MEHQHFYCARTRKTPSLNLQAPVLLDGVGNISCFAWNYGTWLRITSCNPVETLHETRMGGGRVHHMVAYGSDKLLISHSNGFIYLLRVTLTKLRVIWNERATWYPHKYTEVGHLVAADMNGQVLASSSMHGGYLKLWQLETTEDGSVSSKHLKIHSPQLSDAVIWNMCFLSPSLMEPNRRSLALCYYHSGLSVFRIAVLQWKTIDSEPNFIGPLTLDGDQPVLIMYSFQQSPGYLVIVRKNCFDIVGIDDIACGYIITGSFKDKLSLKVKEYLNCATLITTANTGDETLLLATNQGRIFSQPTSTTTVTDSSATVIAILNSVEPSHIVANGNQPSSLLVCRDFGNDEVYNLNDNFLAQVLPAMAPLITMSVNENENSLSVVCGIGNGSSIVSLSRPISLRVIETLVDQSDCISNIRIVHSEDSLLLVLVSTSNGNYLFKFDGEVNNANVHDEFFYVSQETTVLGAPLGQTQWIHVHRQGFDVYHLTSDLVCSFEPLFGPILHACLEGKMLALAFASSIFIADVHVAQGCLSLPNQRTITIDTIGITCLTFANISNTELIFVGHLDSSVTAYLVSPETDSSCLKVLGKSLDHIPHSISMLQYDTSFFMAIGTRDGRLITHILTFDGSVSLTEPNTHSLGNVAVHLVILDNGTLLAYGDTLCELSCSSNGLFEGNSTLPPSYRRRLQFPGIRF